MKKLFKSVAKTALKSSPIPIPDAVMEKIGLDGNKLTDIMDRLQRLEDSIMEIVEFIRELDEYLVEEDDE